MFNSGISREGDIVDLGSALGIMKKSGAFYTYGDIKLGQGRENAKIYLTQNPDLSSEIEKQIISATINK